MLLCFILACCKPPRTICCTIGCSLEPFFWSRFGGDQRSIFTVGDKCTKYVYSWKMFVVPSVPWDLVPYYMAHCNVLSVELLLENVQKIHMVQNAAARQSTRSCCRDQFASRYSWKHLYDSQVSYNMEPKCLKVDILSCNLTSFYVLQEVALS